MATAPRPAAVVERAQAPEAATPAVVVQTERRLEFMKEPELPTPTPPTRHSARTLAEHKAGAEALSNYQ